MSHFVPIKVENQIANQKILYHSLMALGFNEVSSHEEPQQLIDYYNRTSRNTAEIVIPKRPNNLHADAGFRKTEKGFELVADSYDRQVLQNRLSNLKQVCVETSVALTLKDIKAAAKQANKGEHYIQRETLPDGSIVISTAWASDIMTANQNIQQY